MSPPTSTLLFDYLYTFVPQHTPPRRSKSSNVTIQAEKITAHVVMVVVCAQALRIMFSLATAYAWEGQGNAHREDGL